MIRSSPPLSRLLFAATLEEVRADLAGSGAARAVRCRVLPDAVLGEPGRTLPYYRPGEQGFEISECRCVANVMMAFGDEAPGALVLEWDGSDEPVGDMGAAVLAGRLTPPLIALVNAPPGTEEAVREAWEHGRLMQGLAAGDGEWDAVRHSPDPSSSPAP